MAALRGDISFRYLKQFFRFFINFMVQQHFKNFQFSDQVCLMEDPHIMEINVQYHYFKIC